MLVLRMLTVAAAGILSVIVVRQAMQALQAQKAAPRAKAQAQPVTRLRQDPETGIYFPDV